ncbi:MAG TPA: hypothetical protein VNV18_13565, partial [Stellaceae bacterium]|nr:hypothetical protein [Stellaceae bacterium]
MILVGAQRPQIIGDPFFYAQRTGHLTQHVDDVVRGFLNVDQIETEGLPPGKRQNLPDQLFTAKRRVEPAIGQLLDLIVLGSLSDQFELAADHGEQIIEVVRYLRGAVPQGGQFERLMQRRLGLAERGVLVRRVGNHVQGNAKQG